jgi:nucleoside-diphosphate-sugar epimerase
MRLFLTGASGFIGSATKFAAEAAGHSVLAMNRPHDMENLPWRDIERFQPEACVHAAWIATPGVYPESPLNSDHRSWSLRALTRLSAMGLQHFVVLGTCLEYRPARGRLREDTSAIDPRSLYAREKHALHGDLLRLQEQQGFSLAWARLFFPYGPTEHPLKLFSSLFQRCRQQGFLAQDAVRSPFAIRDYIHVADIASAVLVLATARQDGTYNVGTGVGVMLADVARAIAALLGKPCHDWHSTAQATDNDDHFVADNSRLGRLGWRPRFDLYRGLETYCLPG